MVAIFCRCYNFLRHVRVCQLRNLGISTTTIYTIFLLWSTAMDEFDYQNHWSIKSHVDFWYGAHIVNNITGDFVAWKSGETLHKTCRYVKMMTERNRNIKNIMLQRGTNIMANQVKTPIHNYFEKVLYENLTREIPPLWFFFRVLSRGIQTIRNEPVCSDWWISGLTP